MKGIVLAGGAGTRLHPVTLGVSKQLLPVYDKPMIYYPLSTLMLAGVREILIITTVHDLPFFKRLLGSGVQWGLNLNYAVQSSPDGLAQAFIIGAEFIGDSSVVLVLGDNIFYGRGLRNLLTKAASQKSGATIFGYHVSDPERYGVLGFDSKGKVASIEEKPVVPKSNYAIPGIYFYDNNVIRIARELKPSSRGELEITDVNRIYLDSGLLTVEFFSRGFAWLDTGTEDSLLDAGNFVAAVEKRQGLKIACLEEIALSHGIIKKDTVRKTASTMNNEYGRYLRSLVNEDVTIQP